jgi:diaminohydroxyphosphoribosylaminopyrimidine deaminase / 5-amino-6-(5-phosphoribosylamino)uracil reductase
MINRNRRKREGALSPSHLSPIVADRCEVPERRAAQAGSWRMVPQKFRAAELEPLASPWEEIFGPLRHGVVDSLVVVGQIGQSLDGRTATVSGHSQHINGPAGLAHLHRLRALVDVVVIGVSSALADDPQLTVRRVAGPHPARVVLDPRGRLAAGARLLVDDGIRRLIVLAEGARCALPSVEVLTLPAHDGHIAPAAILAGLAKLGFRRILIEGGATTIQRFLEAGCLDRLHVVVAPIILGDGRSSFALGPIDYLDKALRPPMRVYPLDGEVLFDCDFSASRTRVWRTGD